jgi:hypothetical protein
MERWVIPYIAQTGTLIWLERGRAAIRARATDMKCTPGGRHLGQFGEDPDRVRQMFDYVKKGDGTKSLVRRRFQAAGYRRQSLRPCPIDSGPVEVNPEYPMPRCACSGQEVPLPASNVKNHTGTPR